MNKTDNIIQFESAFITHIGEVTPNYKITLDDLERIIVEIDNDTGSYYIRGLEFEYPKSSSVFGFEGKATERFNILIYDLLINFGMLGQNEIIKKLEIEIDKNKLPTIIRESKLVKI